MPSDVQSQVQLNALRRIELIQGARQRSQHLHAAVVISRDGEPAPGGEEAPRSRRARAVLEAYQRVAVGLSAQRLALENEPPEPGQESPS